MSWGVHGLFCPCRQLKHFGKAVHDSFRFGNALNEKIVDRFVELDGGVNFRVRAFAVRSDIDHVFRSVIGGKQIGEYAACLDKVGFYDVIAQTADGF